MRNRWAWLASALPVSFARIKFPGGFWLRVVVLDRQSGTKRVVVRAFLLIALALRSTRLTLTRALFPADIRYWVRRKVGAFAPTNKNWVFHDPDVFFGSSNLTRDC